MLYYRYELRESRGGAGYFACEVEPPLEFEAALRLWETRPTDSFLRRRLLEELGRIGAEELNRLVVEAAFRPALAALLLERGIPDGSVSANFGPAVEFAAFSGPRVVAPRVRGDAAWAFFWNGNINQLSSSSPPALPLPYSETELDAAIKKRSVGARALARARESFKGGVFPRVESPALREIYARARARLDAAGLLAGPEMRHEASLSPIALLRAWKTVFGVGFGASAHRAEGSSFAYGRGLSLAGARVSLYMEIVERACAYAEIVSGGPYGDGLVSGRKTPLPLRRASYYDLLAEGAAAVDPAKFGADPKYARETVVHWLPGRDRFGKTVYAPARATLMFCNLDEPELGEAADSAGLGAGDSPARARLAALCEILERDSRATTPFLSGRGFIPASRDPMLAALLSDYRARGIRVVCHELYSAIGLPVCMTYARGLDGSVAVAAAASLSGKKAFLSALTETPWPYVWAKPAPFGAPTAPAPAGLPVKFIEDLPDYSLSDTEAELRLVESALASLGMEPVYVDISRADLDFPVVRAFIPGLESLPEFDVSHPPGLRLFAAAREFDML